MKPSIYKIDSPTTGSLFQMPKPSGEWLQDDLSFYLDTGVDHIVSLLEIDEQSELSLNAERLVCAEIGLTFTSFPIPDRDIPELGDFQSLVSGLAEELGNGTSIGVHCRAGIGRSGLVTCCILKIIGLDSPTAIRLVSEARGLAVPDTQSQIDFINSF